MKRSLILLSVAGLMLAGVASAEVRKGDIFLDFSAGWTRQELTSDFGGDDVDVFFGSLRPGIALTDNIRVAGVISVTDVRGDISIPALDIETSLDVTAWQVGVSGEYVFMPASTLNPYIGGSISWASADVDMLDDRIDGWLFAPRAGFLYTLNRANNLFGEFQYHIWNGDIDDVLDDGFLVLFGIEHKFRVGQ